MSWARRLRRRLAGLGRDESGATAVVTALALVTLLGFVGLGIDTGVGYSAKRHAQSAADSAAFSAAVAVMAGANNPVAQARAVATDYGLVDGDLVEGQRVTVEVNTPPKAGTHIATTGAVEVIVTRPSPRFFSHFVKAGVMVATGRAVAVAGRAGKGCVVALNPSAPGAVLESGTPDVNLDGCDLYDNSSSSSALQLTGSVKLTADAVHVVGGIGKTGNGTITTKPGGLLTGEKPLPDPYADIHTPPYERRCNYKAGDSFPLHFTAPPDGKPTVFCDGLKLNGVKGEAYTFDPGIYVIDGAGSGNFGLTFNGNISVNGTGVTFVLTDHTGAKYPTATINGTATVHLSAPASGPTAGFVIYQDQAAPTGTNALNGVAADTFKGALYFPRQKVTLNGKTNVASNGCTQVLADTITFNGTPTLRIKCDGVGVRSVGGAPTVLVE